jgi:hypothetical protein
VLVALCKSAVVSVGTAIARRIVASVVLAANAVPAIPVAAAVTDYNTLIVIGFHPGEYDAFLPSLIELLEHVVIDLVQI